MNVYAPLVPVFVVAVLAPLVAGLMPVRVRLPQAVLLLLGGVLIGPAVLGMATPGDVTLLSDLGMGFLFLLAGYELEPSVFREPVGRLAGAAWGTSLLLAAVVVMVLIRPGEEEVLAAGAIALTTTALGVLLPVLQDTGRLDSRLGRAVLVVGAYGELGPIVAMALLLGTRGSGAAAVLLVLFAVLAVAMALLPGFRAPAAGRLLRDAEHGTGQSTLRLTVLLLVGLLAVASALGFDAVLGAFVGGMVLRRWALGDVERLERKLDAVAWGVFVPVFFISSGMALDVASIIAAPALPLVLFALMVVVRGGPVLLWLRRELPAGERVQAALYSATALPLLVALTGIAVDRDLMSSETGAALVGAGVLSVIVLPVVAGRIRIRPSGEPAGRDGGATGGSP